MKRTIMLFALFAVAATGCDKKEEEAKADPAQAEAQAQAEEPAKPEEAAAPAGEEKPGEEGELAAAGGDPQQDCGAIYDKMKTMADQISKGEAKLPERDKYVELCASLPGEVIHCMDPDNAKAEQEKCGKALASIDDATKAKFEELKKCA